MDFLAELHAEEVPVVPPLPGVADGALLHSAGDMRYAVFPKRGGRPLDEPRGNDWAHLGRLVARIHAVGARHAPRDRIRLHPRSSTAAHLSAILDSGAVPPASRQAFEDAVAGLIEAVSPLFEGVDGHRIHGDCHAANILCRPGEGFHILDFDDMAVGPAVQDLWMILPDRLARSRAEAELLLEGYETFMDFPRGTLRLIEPLRAMRFIHYLAWCARQKADGGFSRLTPDWGTPAFWRQEMADLETQRREILDALDAG
jgi:Ser/Thr protein kinase RdoA (MazF antagonist)